ncbi:MAG TPA: CBS domain-containing protein [Stellaceae bacterium]|nr:CBS domain-containing protein [Stellaceae bacterium]
MNVETILRTKGRNVVTVAPNATVTMAAALLRRHGIGALVVSRDGAAIEGILSERDIVHGLAEHGAAALDYEVGRLMSRRVVTSKAGDSIAELMSLMTERRIRHIPVVEHGRLAGIVSIGDVVKNRLDEVESEASSMREFIAGA